MDNEVSEIAFEDMVDLNGMTPYNEYYLNVINHENIDLSSKKM